MSCFLPLSLDGVSYLDGAIECGMRGCVYGVLFRLSGLEKSIFKQRVGINKSHEQIGIHPQASGSALRTSQLFQSGGSSSSSSSAAPSKNIGTVKSHPTSSSTHSIARTTSSSTRRSLFSGLRLSGLNLESSIFSPFSRASGPNYMKCAWVGGVYGFYNALLLGWVEQTILPHVYYNYTLPPDDYSTTMGENDYSNSTIPPSRDRDPPPHNSPSILGPFVCISLAGANSGFVVSSLATLPSLLRLREAAISTNNVAAMSTNTHMNSAAACAKLLSGAARRTILFSTLGSAAFNLCINPLTSEAIAHVITGQLWASDDI